MKSIIFGTLGASPKTLESKLDTLEIRGKINTVQKPTGLDSLGVQESGTRDLWMCSDIQTTMITIWCLRENT